MASSPHSASGIPYKFEHIMSVPDNIRSQHQHHMFNPVTPDVSPPPPPGSMSQYTTPRQQQFLSDSTALGDISNVTSMDIQEMENVRNHLQNMLKTFKGFNIEGDYEQSMHTGTADEDGGANHSMSSVDTAAFLQKLLPNSSPLEELKVHFGDQSRGTQVTDETSGQTPHGNVRNTSGSRRSMQQQQLTVNGSGTSSGANKSLMSENTLLREHLDRERFRRKHCEQQIQELHSKLLEIQQELAVSVSSERKKDVMIEQLDKTLAKVVEGWKRHEHEKLIVIDTLTQEREVQEQSHKKQQEMLLQFEKELSQAVEALTKEQDRATEAEREKQIIIEKQKQERDQLLQVLSKEKDKVKGIDEEKINVVKEKEQAQQKYMQLQRTLEELSEKNSKLQSEITHLKEEFGNSLNQEKKRLQEERIMVKDSKDAMTSLQKDLQRLEMELDTTAREKESLKMEMSLMQARYEASKAKEENERQAELERQVTQKLEELHKQMSKSEKEMRESHRQLVLETNNKHKEEMRQQLEKFHEEVKKKDSKLKTATTEYEERLTGAQDQIASLSNQRQQLEHQRQNLTIRMHQMMQAHCDEALRVLSANRSPGSTDTKVESVFKTSVPEATSKWLQQTFPPSIVSNPMSKYSGTDTGSSYQHYTSIYTPSTQPSTNHNARHRDPATNHHSTRHNEPHREPKTSHHVTQHQIHREPTTNYHVNERLVHKEPTPNHQDTQHYSPTSITAPGYPGYQVNKGYPESGMFSGSYLGGGFDMDGGTEMTRSGVDFVPLKAVQDDHETDSVISGLHESPGSVRGTGGHFPDMDYQLKITSSGGSNGTLLEQDLDDSRMTVTSVSPDIPQRGHDISQKLEEQEQRQAELNHYVNVLLKRSPGHPVDEGLDHLSSGLMAIPSSLQGYAQDDFSPFKTNGPIDYGYPDQSHNGMVGSNYVSKDTSQQPQNVSSSSAVPAFTKSTVPTTFSVKHSQLQNQHQVPRYTHPQTPPRRDKDPINQDTSTQPPLSPKQVKQLSKLLSLMAEGQPGVQVPSTEQLFGVLKEMQNKNTFDGSQHTMAKDTSGISRTNTSNQDNVSHVKRNLDTSLPSSRKQKFQGVQQSSNPNQPTRSHGNQTKTNDQHRARSPSTDGGPPQRSGADQGIPRHQAPTKASSRQVVQPKVDKRPAPPHPGKQTKSSSAWR